VRFEHRWRRRWAVVPGGGRGSLRERIHAGAYSALADAIAAIYWNKRPFETFLRRLLRDQPELLAGLDFNGTKRETADQLVDRLVQNESRYQELSLRLMRELSTVEAFPNLAPPIRVLGGESGC
jgi:hypothetical protein